MSDTHIYNCDKCRCAAFCVNHDVAVEFEKETLENKPDFLGVKFTCDNIIMKKEFWSKNKPGTKGAKKTS